VRSLVSNSIYAKKDRNGPLSANQVISIVKSLNWKFVNWWVCVSAKDGCNYLWEQLSPAIRWNRNWDMFKSSRE